MKRKLLALSVLTVALWAAGNAKVAEADKLVKGGKYGEAITLLDTEYKKNPKSSDVKSGLASAHFAYGEYYLNNNEVPPRVKYPSALKEYRTVLQFDKDNKPAHDRIDLIEGIYKQMGRPIPQ